MRAANRIASTLGITITVFSDPEKRAAKLYCVDWNERGLAFYRKFGMLEKGHMQMMAMKDKIKG